LRNINFNKDAFVEFSEFAETNKKLFVKISKLIIEISRTPFEGIGKPEPLKNELSGYWSRRIDDYNRIIYEVTDEAINIISCKGHY
jgi:toxin YoeB